MKKWFAAGLLVMAAGYTIYGLSTLTLVSGSGRPAAGFFPLLIGGLMVISCAVNLWNDWREEAMQAAPAHRRQANATTKAQDDVPGMDAQHIGTGREYGRDVLIVFLYICAFVAFLKPLGALLAMAVFMLAYLFTFNRAHPISNIIYSLALPAFLYGLFKVLLNASLPIGPLGF
ncbi:tripartite tricarboxylate transporter TctB family protein [Paracoccus sp. Z330]|uniref:Tripartite tricarboxylate transporter TctB family protein n=1 Tax=Paracoccus onchidii TaxID=3017813 RepID=A0ABT4ZAD3_9RHOB|nr:tripartite tricarboxylate transporter TctB family protein [Paracoccus onchidii]MDB6176210.1 tripartite tricarboxylate transporter TctB family protein [Paracoccus onchidii]